MKMSQRLLFLLAALEVSCLGRERRHPAIVGHLSRWLLVTLLIFLLIGLTIIPLEVMLVVLRQTRVDGAALETYRLSAAHIGVLMTGIVVMFAGAVFLAAFAQLVVEQFEERRWSLLLLAVLFACFTLPVFYFTSSSTAMLGFARGDNAMLACFMAAWGGAISLVCAIPTSRTIARWKASFTSFTLPPRG